MTTSTDTEFHPIKQSACGSNAYYLDLCRVTDGRPSYASCLAKIEDRKLGRLSISNAECSVAIGKNICPAQAMKLEEELEGRALFYIDRALLRLQNEARAEMEQSQLEALLAGVRPEKSPRRSSPKADTRPTPTIKPPSSFLDSIGGDYASAINVAVKETVAPIAVKTTVLPPFNVFKKGMSLSEIALAALSRKAD